MNGLTPFSLSQQEEWQNWVDESGGSAHTNDPLPPSQQKPLSPTPLTFNVPLSFPHTARPLRREGPEGGCLLFVRIASVIMAAVALFFFTFTLIYGSGYLPQECFIGPAGNFFFPVGAGALTFFALLLLVSTHCSVPRGIRG